jgi:hypothetical protein
MPVFGTIPKFDPYKVNYPSYQELIAKIDNSQHFDFGVLPIGQEHINRATMNGYVSEFETSREPQIHWEVVIAYWMNRMYEYNHQPHHLSKQHKRNKFKPHEHKQFAHPPMELSQSDIDRWQPVYEYVLKKMENGRNNIA